MPVSVADVGGGGGGGGATIVRAYARAFQSAFGGRDRDDRARQIAHRWGVYSQQFADFARKYPGAAQEALDYVNRGRKNPVRGAAPRPPDPNQYTLPFILANFPPMGLPSPPAPVIPRPDPQVNTRPPGSTLPDVIPVAEAARTSAVSVAARIFGGLGLFLWPSRIDEEVPIPRLPPPAPSTPAPAPYSVPATPTVPGAGSMPAPRPQVRLPDPGALPRPGAGTITIPQPYVSLPLPAPAPMPNIGTQITNWVQAHPWIATTIATQLLPRSSRTLRRTGLVDPLTPGQIPGMDNLTRWLTNVDPRTQAEGRTLEDQCKNLQKRKRKKRKPRAVCYQGTYTEKRNGLIKRKRRKVPCK